MTCQSVPSGWERGQEGRQTSKLSDRAHNDEHSTQYDWLGWSGVAFVASARALTVRVPVLRRTPQRRKLTRRLSLVANKEPGPCVRRIQAQAVTRSTALSRVRDHLH